MGRRSYRFNRLALIELEEAADEYESKSRGLGLRFTDAVEASILSVCNHPEMASVVAGSIRRKLVISFPYSILYVTKRDHVRILAIAHERRLPFYWLRRT